MTKNDFTFNIPNGNVPKASKELRIVKKRIISHIPDREKYKIQYLLKSGRINKGLAGPLNISCDRYKAELSVLLKMVRKAQLRGFDFRTVSHDINQKGLCYLSKILNRLKGLNHQLKLILELGHNNLQYEANPYIRE